MAKNTKELETNLKIYKRAVVPADTAWDRPSYNPYTIARRYAQDLLEYTWLDRALSFVLFDRVSNIYNGVINLWNWLPVIWEDRNWDEHYILKVLQRKIEIQRDYLVRNNRHTNIEMDNRDMTIVLNLLERELLEYYELELYDYFESSFWFENVKTHDKFQVGSPDSPERNEDDLFTFEETVLSEQFDAFLSKYVSSQRHVLKHEKDIDLSTTEGKKRFCRLVAKHNQEKSRKLLFKILHDRGAGWWD